jgi:hypothetical protein
VLKNWEVDGGWWEGGGVGRLILVLSPLESKLEASTTIWVRFSEDCWPGDEIFFGGNCFRRFLTIVEGFFFGFQNFWGLLWCWFLSWYPAWLVGVPSSRQAFPPLGNSFSWGERSNDGANK